MSRVPAILSLTHSAAALMRVVFLLAVSAGTAVAISEDLATCGIGQCDNPHEHQSSLLQRNAGDKNYVQFWPWPKADDADDADDLTNTTSPEETESETESEGYVAWMKGWGTKVYNAGTNAYKAAQAAYKKGMTAVKKNMVPKIDAMFAKVNTGLEKIEENKQKLRKKLLQVTALVDTVRTEVPADKLNKGTKLALDKVELLPEKFDNASALLAEKVQKFKEYEGQWQQIKKTYLSLAQGRESPEGGDPPESELNYGTLLNFQRLKTKAKASVRTCVLEPLQEVRQKLEQADDELGMALEMWESVTEKAGEIGDNMNDWIDPVKNLKSNVHKAMTTTENAIKIVNDFLGTP